MDSPVSSIALTSHILAADQVQIPRGETNKQTKNKSDVEKWVVATGPQTPSLHADQRVGVCREPGRTIQLGSQTSVKRSPSTQPLWALTSLREKKLNGATALAEGELTEDLTAAQDFAVSVPNAKVAPDALPVQPDVSLPPRSRWLILGEHFRSGRAV